MEKLYKAVLRIIAVFGSLVFFFLTLYSWRFTRILSYGEILTDTQDSFAMNLLVVFVVLLLAFFLCRFFSPLSQNIWHILALGTSCLVAIACFIFCKNANPYPVGDQLQIYLTAESLYSGNTQWLKDYEYFRIYPFQLGLSSLYSLFFRLCGHSSFLVIQSIQSILSGFSIYAGFRITRELFQKRQAEGLYLILAVCFIPLYFYSGYIYGESIGICSTLYAILCYLLMLKNWNFNKPKRYMFAVLTTFFLSVTYLIRSALLIVWIAMFLMQLIMSLKNKKILPAILVLLMLPVMLLTQRAIVGLTEASIGSNYGSGCPLIMWIAMGAQENENDRGPGSFNDFNRLTFIDCGYNISETSKKGIESLQKSLNTWMDNPSKMIRFFKEKILNQWNEPTYGAIQMTCYLNEPAAWVSAIYEGIYSNTIYLFMDRYQALFFFAIMGYFITLLHVKPDPILYFIGLILLGGFCFSIIWEAKSRYVFPYLMIALPCAAGSIDSYMAKAAAIIHNRTRNSHHT